MIKSHQDNLIKKLQIPDIFENENKLYLGNRALEQLNVLPKSGEINDSQQISLFDIINYNKSVLGKRF